MPSDVNRPGLVEAIWFKSGHWRGRIGSQYFYMGEMLSGEAEENAAKSPLVALPQGASHKINREATIPMADS